MREGVVIGMAVLCMFCALLFSCCREQPQRVEDVADKTDLQAPLLPATKPGETRAMRAFSPDLPRIISYEEWLTPIWDRTGPVCWANSPHNMGIILGALDDTNLGKDAIRAISNIGLQMALAGCPLMPASAPLNAACARFYRWHGGSPFCRERNKFGLVVPIDGTPVTDPRSNDDEAALWIYYDNVIIVTRIIEEQQVGDCELQRVLHKNVEAYSGHWPSRPLELAGTRYPWACSILCLPGDVNGDGAVTEDDMGPIRQHLNQRATTENFRCDLDLNGVINSADLLIVRDNMRLE